MEKNIKIRCKIEMIRIDDDFLNVNRYFIRYSNISFHGIIEIKYDEYKNTFWCVTKSGCIFECSTLKGIYKNRKFIAYDEIEEIATFFNHFD